MSGGSKVVKLLVPHLFEACTQKGSYEKVHKNSHPQSEIFPTSSPPWRIIRASWCTWRCTHCPYMGCLNNCPGEPWRRRWTKLRLQCHCMSTEREGVMWMDSHRLGRHNLGTGTRCSNGKSRVRWRNGIRYWHGGGVGGVHLLHGSVLCTLPLTSGGVGIGLGGSIGLATSTRAVCWSWSSFSPASLVSVP